MVTTSSNLRALFALGGIFNKTSVRSTTGFVGTEAERQTDAQQMTAPLGGGFTTIVTLGTLSASDRNMKFDVWVTAQDNADPTNFVSVKLAQAAWRDSATNLATVHESDEQGNGSTFLTDVAFDLSVSTNDVILRVQNTSGTTAYTMNVAVRWESQEGGFST